jgi:hypothetical protein
MASIHVLSEYLVPGVLFITYDWDKRKVNLYEEADRQLFVKYKNNQHQD